MDFNDPEIVLGVTAMDLDMTTFERYLSPLKNVTNVQGVFLVSTPNSDVVFSLYQDVDV